MQGLQKELNESIEIFKEIKRLYFKTSKIAFYNIKLWLNFPRI